MLLGYLVVRWCHF